MQCQHIVITGSSRGIGYGLAESFLSLGCTITISGRTSDTTKAATESLIKKFDPGRMIGIACDVTSAHQLQELWNRSVRQYNKVDVWINNAGISGEMRMAWEHSEDDLRQIINTNILGVILGSQIAFSGMLAQGHGAIYNLEGMGSDGRKHAGLTPYGTTKCAVHYFSEGLALEARGTPVIIGMLRPGMVNTRMISDRYRDHPREWARAKRIFNILAERAEVITPWLAHKILANRKNGAVLKYPSALKMLWRYISSQFSHRTAAFD